METFDQPVWLLDVAGVVFPTTRRPGWGGPPRRVDIIVEDGRILKECYAVQLVKEIREIILTGRADVQWATSWCDEADKLEKVFSFPPLKRAFPACAPGSLNEKILAAKRVLNSGRRLIWTDDVVIPQWGPVYDQLTANDRSLLIRPNPKRGLQPEDMESIRNFIGIEVPV